MQITRRFTREGQDPFAGHRRSPRGSSKIVNPNGSVVFEMNDVHGPGRRGRRWRSTSSRRSTSARPACRRSTARVAEEGVPDVAAAERAAPTATRRSVGETRQPAGVPPPGRLLDVLGLEGRLLHQPRRDAQAFYDETCYMLAAPDGRPEQPAVVQHRPALGLRHRRPGRRGTTTSTRRPASCEQSTDAYEQPAAARLLHPERQRRPRERRRHHGPVGPRGPHLQVRLAAPARTSPRSAARASRCPAAASRPA